MKKTAEYLKNTEQNVNSAIYKNVTFADCCFERFLLSLATKSKL